MAFTEQQRRWAMDSVAELLDTEDDRYEVTVTMDRPTDIKEDMGPGHLAIREYTGERVITIKRTPHTMFTGT